jgi:hypothetical protein
MKTEEEILTALDPWTYELQGAAQREGWDLFTTTDSTSEVQVQRIDDPDELPPGGTHLASDQVALAYVRCGTGEHHRIARNIIHTHFPTEWENMQAAYRAVFPDASLDFRGEGW